MKPTVTNARFVAVVIERLDRHIELLDYEKQVGFIRVPRWWEFWRKFEATMFDPVVTVFINCGKFDTAQAAMDALVAAYEGNGEAG